MDKSELDRLVKLGLEPGQQNGPQDGVKIIGPEGKEIVVPAAVGAYFALGNIAQLLQVIQNQLDLLVRMESGVVSRSTIRKRIEEAEALAAAMAEEIAEPEGAPDAS